MLLESAFSLITSIQKRQDTERERNLIFLKKMTLRDAIYELRLDEQKIAFWVNIYNAFFQMKAVEFEQSNAGQRSDFFKKRQISLFGLSLSFDDIEHVILRRSKLKRGLGFIPSPFVKKELRGLRVAQLDYRVHFLLNCGAVSCPMIYPINSSNYSQILKAATQGYLEQEVRVDSKRKEIIVNQLFLFYLGDFGGRKGLKKILLLHAILKESELNFHFKFIPFDKSLKLDHFIA